MSETKKQQTTVVVGQMQQKPRRPRKKLLHTFSGAELTFQRGNPEFPESRVASISVTEISAKRPFPGFPVFPFRPIPGVPYTLDGGIYGREDDLVSGRMHYHAVLWPSYGCNNLEAGKEILTDKQFLATLKFEKGDGPRPVARHPDTGQRVVPTWKSAWLEVLGRDVQDGDILTVNVQPVGDNRLIAHPMVEGKASGNPAETGQALVVTDPLDILADTRKQLVLTKHGMRHFAAVLGIATPLLSLSKDEVSKARRSLSKGSHPDRVAKLDYAKQKAARARMDAINAAADLAEAFIEAREKAKEEGKLDELIKATEVKVVTASNIKAAPVQGATTGATPAVQERAKTAGVSAKVDDVQALELLND